MKIAGIIAEYNPFHLGHQHQINILKKEMNFDIIVAVMSTCAVQRGALALFPTEVRVKAALKCGVDLVIELPAPYSTMSAEGFARAGVELLASIGCVDTIAFGSEAGNTQELLQAKDALYGETFESTLSEYLSSGMEFAKARAKAAGKVYPNAERILNTPNNILGVEYCKAINELNASITPLALLREGAFHDDDISYKGTIQSASAMRELIKTSENAFFEAAPPSCEDIYKEAIRKGNILNCSKFEIAVLSRLRNMTATDFAQIRGTNEGLEYRLENAVKKAKSIDELYTLLKCRRYSHARMRRLVLDAALGFNTQIPKNVPYIHVLGANNNGIKLLKLAKVHGAKPVSPSLSVLERQGEQAAIVANLQSKTENFAALCFNATQICGTAYTSFMLKG